MNFVREHKFHPKRKWRFDYANLENKIAVEVEGGAYANGRHTRSTGFINDMEKYNEALVLGWRVIRVTPQQFRHFKHIDIIKRWQENELKQLQGE